MTPATAPASSATPSSPRPTPCHRTLTICVRGPVQATRASYTVSHCPPHRDLSSWLPSSAHGVFHEIHLNPWTCFSAPPSLSQTRPLRALPTGQPLHCGLHLPAWHRAGSPSERPRGRCHRALCRRDSEGHTRPPSISLTPLPTSHPQPNSPALWFPTYTLTRASDCPSPFKGQLCEGLPSPLALPHPTSAFLCWVSCSSDQAQYLFMVKASVLPQTKR